MPKGYIWGNDGSIINQYSYLFDGVNEYININAVRTALATTTVGTWSCWVKPVDTTPAVTSVIIGFGDTDANSWLEVWLNTLGSVRVGQGIGGTTKWIASTTNVAFSDGVWGHVVIVQDGVSPVIYINGVAVAQTFPTSTDKTTWFNSSAGLDNGRIACDNLNNSGNANFFNGNIDEVGFFNTNLSAAQISEIYNNGKPKNLLKHSAVSNLVSYFRMGDNDTWDGTNWTLIDKKGTNNGTSVNMEFADNELDVP